MFSLMNAFSVKNCSTFISLHIFALGIKHEILRGLRKLKRLTVQENPNCFFSADVTLNNQYKNACELLWGSDLVSQQKLLAQRVTPSTSFAYAVRRNITTLQFVFLYRKCSFRLFRLANLTSAVIIRLLFSNFLF